MQQLAFDLSPAPKPPKAQAKDWTKEIVKAMESLTGRHDEHRIFADWVEMMAISIQNAVTMPNELWQSREDQYLEIAKRYSNKELTVFSEMMGMLVETLTHHYGDILGEIFMAAGLGSSAGGQFFTPFNVSLMMAEISLSNLDWEADTIPLHEPTCGSGGMVIAATVVARRKKQDIRKFRVVAQDIDWRSVYMCYVQLSLIGIRGIVVQGDTLNDPYHRGYPPERVFYTPGQILRF